MCTLEDLYIAYSQLKYAHNVVICYLAICDKPNIAGLQ
jgi:hypothetical protein